jgi:hypothetical protein
MCFSDVTSPHLILVGMIQVLYSYMLSYIHLGYSLIFSNDLSIFAVYPPLLELRGLL